MVPCTNIPLIQFLKNIMDGSFKIRTETLQLVLGFRLFMKSSSINQVTGCQSLNEKWGNGTTNVGNSYKTLGA